MRKWYLRKPWILISAIQLMVSCSVADRNPREVAQTPGPPTATAPATPIPTIDATYEGPPSSESNTRAHLNLAKVQKRFGVERAIQVAVPTPTNIWRQIVNEENTTQSSPIETENEPSKWVRTSPIDINSDGVQDYVVVGVRIPLLGANITRFWIFLGQKGGSYTEVFKTSATEIDISKPPEHGLPVITTIRISMKGASESVFHYNGASYELVDETMKSR